MAPLGFVLSKYANEKREPPAREDVEAERDGGGVTALSQLLTAGNETSLQTVHRGNPHIVFYSDNQHFQTHGFREFVF